jgi:hypothetical protein
MTLGSTQPLTQMSTRSISWGEKGGRCVGLTTLPPSCANCLEILTASTPWNPKGLSRSVMGLLYVLRQHILCLSLWHISVSQHTGRSTDWQRSDSQYVDVSCVGLLTACGQLPLNANNKDRQSCELSESVAVSQYSNLSVYKLNSFLEKCS